jgi:formamidopyrimidine-DNA glycosylase
MPELAEVEFYRKQWNAGLNQKILAVQLNAGKRIFRGTDVNALQRQLAGATLLDSKAHGKQMLFRFSKGGWLGIHLGMTGKLRVEKFAVPGCDRRAPEKHDHLVLHQARQRLVFSDPRQFGRVLFHEGKQEPPWWSNLPPSLLAKEFTLAAMQNLLQCHRQPPIKAVLLLQSGFPGIGNWMADEILWRAKILPQTPAGKIEQEKVKLLWKEIRFVCKQALRIIGENYADLPKTWLFEHRWKKGGHCPRCRTGLKHATIGGRTTCWCPGCQK